MNMSDDKLKAYRSQAISMALINIFDERQTAEAMQLWETRYAGMPIFSVQYFARDCCALPSVNKPNSELLKNLVRELYLQLHTLENIQLDQNRR